MPVRNAPFRADHVGSLLRTRPLKDARERHAKGEITPGALKDVADASGRLGRDEQGMWSRSLPL